VPPTDPSADPSSGARPGPTSVTEFADGPGPVLGADVEDTLDLRLPDGFLDAVPEDARSGGVTEAGTGAERGVAWPVPDRGDLLDRVGEWGPAHTSAGVLQLVPVHPERDLPLIIRWMNDPAVAAFWDLAGPPQVAEEHLRGQLAGDGRSVPCLGLLDGSPMSYWEIYRADLDPLARHYPARPHDTGIHLLIGGVADRGRGLGSTLLRAVADLALDSRPTCARVIAEPDLRNTPSVAAFLTAGFRFSAEVDLPGKRAALMVRDRHLRHVL
jgi:RimJ/RimL family protein N-acetyltransferase